MIIVLHSEKSEMIFASHRLVYTYTKKEKKYSLLITLTQIQ